MPKAQPDVLPNIACAFPAKFSPISYFNVSFADIRVPIALPNMPVLVYDCPVIFGHFTRAAIRVRIVNTCEYLPRPLDIKIAAPLDLIGASSGYASLTVNNKQAAAPFITVR